MPWPPPCWPACLPAARRARRPRPRYGSTWPPTPWPACRTWASWGAWPAAWPARTAPRGCTRSRAAFPACRVGCWTSPCSTSASPARRQAS
ncbi:hypothetical protein EPA99_17200 [Pseudoxanthomonas composti]|uniref:Uncharacterized protein n=1 Tax=Pseudoxanthomonas composti TaxID=2137479 RepID=A0A4Q1JRK6_9GAMM|nr:hypothetical protein EPA99_17200 [Pseudoxanthomonas composti]